MKKNVKKFKSELAKYKNGVYIRKSSVMLDLNTKLKDDG
jgi:hypothetical protein